MRNFIFPTVLVGIAVISFLLYTNPAYDKAEDLRASIEEYDTALSRVMEIQEIRDELLIRYNSISESDFYILYKILPDEVKSARFLIELDQVATEHGLTIQEPQYINLDEDEARGSGAYKETQVIFSTTGSYEDVKNLIRDVERSARLLDIVRLSVVAEPQRGAVPRGVVSSVPSGEMNRYQITAKIYSLNGLPEKE
ncbi:MAG: type 4a pilus biogenesis protein PilO [Candidatus Paceibacterota bacterium]